MRVPSIVGVVVAVVLAAALGCGSPPPSSSPEIADHLCPVLFPAGDPVDTVTVALFDRVDASHAPNWTNRSEQILFAHLYETLSIESAMCAREPLAQVALSDSARVATFTLREGARFWDGTPVTARDATTSLIQGESIDSVFALDKRRLRVRLRGNVDWAALESPRLAIVKWEGKRWPIGTGSYRFASEQRGTIILEPTDPERDPVLRFIDARNVDPRDLIDGSFQPLVDVMVLDDVVAVDYARSQGLQHVELYPAKAYVLLSPPRAHAVYEGIQIPMIPRSALQSMAREAVRTVNAQALEESDPRWSRSRGCKTGGDSLVPMAGYMVATSVARPHRVAYDLTDPMSRDIAERIIALAGGDTNSSTQAAAIHAALPGLIENGKALVAAGMERIVFAENLLEGREFAYVLAVPINRPEPCFVAAALVKAAPWLAASSVERMALPLCVVGSFVVAAKTDGFGYDLRLDPYGGFIVVGRDPEEPR